MKVNKLKCDETKKLRWWQTQKVTTLKSSNYDQTKKLKLLQN